MALRNAAGTILTRAQVLADTTNVSSPDPELQVNVDIYVDTEGPAGNPTGHTELKWRNGDTIKQSELDALYPLPTVAACAPANGGVAGGTNVTITGTGFVRGEEILGGAGTKSGQGVTVSFAGVAATNVKVVDDETITCTTPAHAAAAADIVVTTAAGTVTHAAGFTYA